MSPLLPLRPALLVLASSLLLVFGTGDDVVSLHAANPEDDDRAAARALVLPDLQPGDLTAWRSHIRPSPAELDFSVVPWHPSLVSGLRAADEEGRPLLLWLMNGHPLGCT